MNTQTFRAPLAAIAVALLLLPVVAAAQHKDESGKSVELPMKVMEALHKKFPKVEHGKHSKETEDGKTVYDVEFTQEGVKFEADYLEDGTLMSWEQETSASQLPAAVKSAVEKKFHGAKPTSVMAVHEMKGGKDKLEGYEVTVKANGKETEATFAPDGKMIEDEDDKDGDKD